MSDTLSYISDLLFQVPRQFGGILPDCVVEESHVDNLAVTEHPVESGAPVTDHSFVRPAELKVRAGWSPSAPAVPGLLGSFIPISTGLVSGIERLFNGGPDYLEAAYQQMFQLMATREPMEVVTGKRIYSSMLITSLSTETTKETEYSLFLTISFKQVIIVKTVTTNVAAQANQREPASTAPARDQGTQQPRPITPNQSILSRVGRAFGG